MARTEMTPSSSNEILPPDSQCGSYINFEVYSLIISSCIIIILCLLEKRSKTSILKKCGRRPALTYPVNMLDHGCDNFGYAMAFGSVASHCFQLFTDGVFFNGPSWSHTLFVMMYVLVYGLMFYPLFACLTTSWVFVGSILGLGYTGLWLYINFSRLITCPLDGLNGQLSGETIAVRLPVLICLVGLFLRFGFLLGKHSNKAWRDRKPSSLIQQFERERLGTKYNVQYVKELLLARCRSRGPDMVPEHNTPCHRKLMYYIRYYLYRPDPTFKYSPRIACIFTLSLICAYQSGILIVLGTYQLMKFVHYLYPNTSAPANVTGDDPDAYFQIRLFLTSFSISALIAFVLSSLLTLYSIFQILVNYRNNIKLLYKGKATHLPFKRSDRHPIFILSDSLSYTGSQIGYILWGFLIVFVLLLITALSLSYLIVLPIFNLVPRTFLQITWNLLPGVLILQVVYIAQKLFSRGLLQSRESIDDKGRETHSVVLAVNNRKVYHNVSYFLFFFYIVLGLFGCFVTIIKGVILGVIYLARMDRCGLVSGFETWDNGYMYYTSFLHWEVSHRHPVLLVFCDILLDGLAAKQRCFRLNQYGAVDSLSTQSGHATRDDLSLVTDRQNNDINRHDSVSNDIRSISVSNSVDDWNINLSMTKRIARNRWLKAYTLIRNPGAKQKSIEEDYDVITDSELHDEPSLRSNNSNSNN